MAITTYAELQTAVGNWLDRSDLSSRLPEFIVLFESEANRRLRVRQQQTSTNLTPSSGVATLPTDYLEYIRVTRLASSNQDLQYVDPSYLSIAFPTMELPPAGFVAPGMFTIEGTSLKVKPVDDSSQIQLLYYAKVPALVQANESTHWLFQAHPDVYLAGTLAEAVVFTEAADQAQLWIARRDAAFAAIERLDRAGKGIGARRPTGPTP